MDPSYVILILVGALLVFGGIILWLQGRLAAATSEMNALEGEEHRMFDFLHVLGLAIEEDYTPRKLYRVIVEGVEEVIGADGAGLYLLSEDGTSLVPACITEGCPPTMPIPGEVGEKLAGDAGALLDYLRLNKVPRADGVIGRCLQASESMRVADLRAREELGHTGRLVAEDTELMVSPMKHAGRDLGVLVAARSGREPSFNENDFDVFRAMVEQSAFALGNALVHQEVAEKRQLDRELRLARTVQRVLLPVAEPAFAGYRIHGTNVPARLISGDYYDYIPLGPDRLGVAIADVSGKGASAGLLMAGCRSALRAVATREETPATLLAEVNRQLFADMREDMFISMAFVVLEGENISLCRAGHDAPLMFRKAAADVEVLKPGGLAIGLDSGPVFERVTGDHKDTMTSGDCLLLYTDGVTEAENRSGEEFGKERLRTTFRDLAEEGAERVVAGLQETLREFAGGTRQMDDITLIAIEKR